MGGEITKTPEEATKSVPQKIELVHQSEPNQQQRSPQKANPEPVVETVVSESVPVTESDQTVAITVSEQIQTTTHPSSITITNDQPFLHHPPFRPYNHLQTC